MTRIWNKHKLNTPLKRKVFVAMSGGVDSSVAALLLARKGYSVIGVFMRCYNLDGCAERDAEDARRVAGHLGIPFYVWDFEEEYKKRVVEYMIRGYRRGITPNPDVMCNREIKFGLFFKKAIAMGADYVATGHYARIKKAGKHFRLFCAKDASKDQSYFLWTLTQKELRKTLFPIGEYVKSKVRATALRAGLPVAGKKDSQGICFLGKVGVGDFLSRYLPKKRGDVVTARGSKIGEHDGAWFYTIGQRHGLNLSVKRRETGARGSVPIQAHYVSAKDVKKNIVTVAEGGHDKALFKKELTVLEPNFITSAALRSGRCMAVFARVRYRQPLAKARMCFAVRRKNILRIVFHAPQKFIAPGQSVVWYSKSGELLGGGVIGA